MSDITLAAHRARLDRLETPGGTIAYLDIGPRNGQPVVLVHGMPTSSYLYREVAQQLAAAGLRAIAPDLLGFGASDKPHDPAAYELRAEAARLTQLLDHLGLADAVFVAHDLGGPWTFEVADREPQRISGLVVLNTSAYAELMTPPREARLMGSPIGPVLARAMGSRLGKPMIHKFLADFTYPGTRISREVTDAHWVPLHEGGTRAFRQFAVGLDATMAEFARHAAALRRLDVPATIIWGSTDPVLRAERIVPRFAADLRVEPEYVHILDGASHFLQEDRPGDVAALITRFVTREMPRREDALAASA